VSKGIHKVQVGDLVRSIKYSYSSYELFMVVEINDPKKLPHGRKTFRGDPLKIHELTLKLWEVTEPTGHTHYAPANLYEVV
jgi:hypothetical protein|tara:strand:+ start:133 stop:375 length:243 start_codon:yes stop_codon:yes gene_type:complete